MKVAIMQPYFFPYQGYFSLIKHSDSFILFDTVQFIRHGWIERNRVLKPGEGWQYVAAPLEKHNRDTIIKDLRIRNTEDWKGKLFRQIEHYKKAPFYREAIPVMEKALAIKTDSIVELNANILKEICAYLHIPLDLKIFSQMGLQIAEATHPGEWALNISKAIGAKEYINPSGGVDIFQTEQFREAGITLTFMANDLPPYSQRRPLFEAGLSIIDVMMFNDIEAINRQIDAIRIVASTSISQ